MVDYMNLEYAPPPPEEPPTLTDLYERLADGEATDEELRAARAAANAANAAANDDAYDAAQEWQEQRLREMLAE